MGRKRTQKTSDRTFSLYIQSEIPYIRTYNENNTNILSKLNSYTTAQAENTTWLHANSGLELAAFFSTSSP